MQKKLHDLSDPYIEAAIDFQEGSPLLLSDKQVKGPQLRIGEPSRGNRSDQDCALGGWHGEPWVGV